MEKKVYVLFLILAIFLSTITIAQEYNLDIQTDKNSYTPGENVRYNTLLYDSKNQPINEKIDVLIYDAKNTVSFKNSVQSNKFSEFYIEKNYPSGYWTIQTEYNGEKVTRLFLIQSNENAEFSIEEKNLIIKNMGNSRYTREVHIAIGDNIVTYYPDLQVGETKSIKLVAPEGVYIVEVTDGNQEFRKEGVALTGEIIGFLDEESIKSIPFFKIFDPAQGFVNYGGGKYSIAIIFIIAVFGIFIALTVIRRVKRKRPIKK